MLLVRCCLSTMPPLRYILVALGHRGWDSFPDCLLYAMFFVETGCFGIDNTVVRSVYEVLFAEVKYH